MVASDEKFDAYSFGVVTLELVMRRNPGGLLLPLSSGSSSSLVLPENVKIAFYRVSENVFMSSMYFTSHDPCFLEERLIVLGIFLV